VKTKAERFDDADVAAAKEAQRPKEIIDRATLVAFIERIARCNLDPVTYGAESDYDRGHQDGVGLVLKELRKVLD